MPKLEIGISKEISVPLNSNGKSYVFVLAPVAPLAQNSIARLLTIQNMDPSERADITLSRPKPALCALLFEFYHY